MNTRNEGPKSMLDAWLDSQKILWESWMDMVSATQDESASWMPQNALDLWGKIVQQSLGTWSSSAAPIAQSAAEQFFSAQEIGVRLLSFTTQAWEAIAPKMESGQDWQADFQEVVEQFQRQWVQFPKTAVQASQDVNQLWNLYMEQWRSFGQPWEAVWQKSPEHLSRAFMGDGSAYIGLSNLYREAYQNSFARLVASPNLGMTREFNGKIQLGFDSWVSWQLAILSYQGVLEKIWDQAFQKFYADLLALAKKDEKIESLQDLILLWTRGAEKVFTENFRTQEYVLAQGEMLNAGMAYRIHERTIIESFLSLYDLPTRSELDEAHRRIYELRKEVKALKKALEALQAGDKGGAS